MTRIARSALFGLGLMALLPAVALAHTDFYVGIGVDPAYGYAPPPPPVVYAPQPTYYGPPVVYGYQPYGYQPYGWHRDGWREHEWREHEWREHEWREHEWHEHH